MDKKVTSYVSFDEGSRLMDKKVTSSFVSFGEQLSEALKRWKQAMVQTQSNLKSVFGYLDSLNLQLPNIWNGLNLDFRKALGQIPEAQKKAEILGAFGWTPPMDATPAEFVAIMNSVHDIPSAEKALTIYYTERNAIRLKRLKRRLMACAYLNRWKPALKEAILNLNEGRYRSSVALLLPLVEGVTAIKFKELHLEKANVRERFFKKKMDAINDGYLKKSLWRSLNRFFILLFEYADFEDLSYKPRFLNRPWLLHGRGIADSKMSDCLTLLQTLDIITVLD
jgi:hypothetical protein